MANQTGDITSFNQQLNPLTGDIQFNPASWGLTMKDIEAASLNVKTAIYSGNINLTADFYQQIKDISDYKYSAIESDGSISSASMGRFMTATGRVYDPAMTGKDPGLYMDSAHIGYWSGTDWKVDISNDGHFFFGSELLFNYVRWDGTTLTVQGNILLPGGETVAEAIAAIDVSWDALSGKPGVLANAAISTPTPTGSGFQLTNSHMGYYNSGVWKTYMKNDGTFGLAGSGSNSLTWDGTTLEIKGSLKTGSIDGDLTMGTGGSIITSDGIGVRATMSGGGILFEEFFGGGDNSMYMNGKKFEAISDIGGVPSRIFIMQTTPDISNPRLNMDFYYGLNITGSIGAISGGMVIGDASNVVKMNCTKISFASTTTNIGDGTNYVNNINVKNIRLMGQPAYSTGKTLSGYLPVSIDGAPRYIAIYQD